MFDNFYGSFIRVRENRVILTNEPVMPYCRQKREIENLHEHRHLAYNGYLSISAGKTIEKRLTCWFQSMLTINRDTLNTGKVREYLPVMITVTLSDTQKHDDRWVKRNILQEFLKALGRKKGIKFTFWKAEAQLNGNIHFHILIDRWIDQKFVQGLWNHYQRKAGYMDHYYSEHHHYNSPSTHIEGMQNNKTPIGYVLKYIKKKGVKTQHCKQTEAGCKLVVKQLNNIRRPIDGAVFRFSSALVHLTPPTIYADMDLHSHFRDIQSSGQFRYVHCDYCDILFTNKCNGYDLLLPFYQNEIDNYYRDIYNQLYNPEYITPQSKQLLNIRLSKHINYQLSFFDANEHNVTVLN